MHIFYHIITVLEVLRFFCIEILNKIFQNQKEFLLNAVSEDSVIEIVGH